MSILLALTLQVGPNPNLETRLGVPDELANRPPREDAITAADGLTSQWLQECLDQLGEDPARAHSKAQIRKLEVTGPDRVVANHCLGLAATELGLWDDARAAFLAAREETPVEEPRPRARFALMAGNAAVAGGNLDSALSLITMAETDARTAASATLEALAATDRARVLVALQRPHDALTALAAATRLEPEQAEGWLLTATLHRRLGRLDDAQEAIEEASKLAPLEAEIGLEAGVIAVLSGREDAARASWNSVIAIQPDSLAAASAKDYLAQLGPPETATDTPDP